MDIWQSFENKKTVKSEGHELQKTAVDKARLAVLYIIKKMRMEFEALELVPDWKNGYYKMKNDLEWRWEAEKDEKMENAPPGVVPALKRPFRLELQDWLWTMKYGEKTAALKATEQALETSDLAVVQDRFDWLQKGGEAKGGLRI